MIFAIALFLMLGNWEANIENGVLRIRGIVAVPDKQRSVVVQVPPISNNMKNIRLRVEFIPDENSVGGLQRVTWSMPVALRPIQPENVFIRKQRFPIRR